MRRPPLGRTIPAAGWSLCDGREDKGQETERHQCQVKERLEVMCIGATGASRGATWRPPEARPLLTHPRAVGRLERRGGPVGARHIRRWQGEIGPRYMVYCSDST